MIRALAPPEQASDPRIMSVRTNAITQAGRDRTEVGWLDGLNSTVQRVQRSTPCTGVRQLSASPQRQPPPDFAKRLDCVEACFRFGGRPLTKSASKLGRSPNASRMAAATMLGRTISAALRKYILSTVLLMPLFGQTHPPGRNLSSARLDPTDLLPRAGTR